MRKILIAEDEKLLRKALHKNISEKTSLDICYEASNGKEALEYLYKHKVDILITDIRMPVMDGLELITGIKEAGLSVKTIVVSGYSDFEYTKHMLKNGAFSYLLKPFASDELVETLQSACQALEDEERKRNIVKSYQFHTLAQKNYVHFTDEMPLALLESKDVFACCVDFKAVCDRDMISKFQFDLESIFYPSTCFLLDAYLYLITSLEEYKNDRLDIVPDLQAYFSEQGVSVKIGIGLAASGMMQVSQSMKQARKALKYYKHLSYNEFVDYERISLLEAPTPTYPLTREKELLEAINHHEPDEIQKSIRLFHEFFSEQDTDDVYQILTELTIFCKREHLPYKLPSYVWEELLSDIQHRQSWETILLHLGDILLGAQLKLSESRKLGNHDTIARAQQYIKNHKQEAITLEDVANECYLSKSHFCKIFKEETGLTFKSYLNELRIEHAKILLKSSDLKNYEIAIAVGLENASYFNELFKKSVGVTPAEFRD